VVVFLFCLNHTSKFACFCCIALLIDWEYITLQGGPKKTGPLYIFPNIWKTTEDK